MTMRLALGSARRASSAAAWGSDMHVAFVENGVEGGLESSLQGVGEGGRGKEKSVEYARAEVAQVLGRFVGVAAGGDAKFGREGAGERLVDDEAHLSCFVAVDADGGRGADFFEVAIEEDSERVDFEPCADGRHDSEDAEAAEGAAGEEGDSLEKGAVARGAGGFGHLFAGFVGQAESMARGHVVRQGTPDTTQDRAGDHGHRERAGGQADPGENRETAGGGGGGAREGGGGAGILVVHGGGGRSEGRWAGGGVVGVRMRLIGRGVGGQLE